MDNMGLQRKVLLFFKSYNVSGVIAGCLGKTLFYVLFKYELLKSTCCSFSQNCIEILGDFAVFRVEPVK